MARGFSWVGMGTKMLQAVHLKDQIYTELRAMVRADRCEVGSRLPSTRALAEQYQVSLATAQAALRMLEHDGLVSCEVGRGTFVRRVLAPSEPLGRGQTTLPAIGVLTGVHKAQTLFHPHANWTAGILFGIQQGLVEDGYALHLVPFDYLRQSFKDLNRRLASLAPALSGLLTFSFGPEDPFRRLIDRFGLGWVTINQFDHLTTRNFVAADYYGGGVEVGRLFAESDRERILFIRAKTDGYSARQKEDGLRAGLGTVGAAGRHVDVIESQAGNLADGREIAARYLREASRTPGAILATGDLLAMGAMKACQDYGLHVPDDVAVVGSTGIEVGEHSTPTLTTIDLPMVEMGQKAAKMLLFVINNRKQEVPGEILPVHLVRRGSTPSTCGPEPGNEVAGETGRDRKTV